MILVGPDTVCVIDSYSVQVACAGRGAPFHAFGKEGAGPGEFRVPLSLVRGPDGTLGVVDGKLSRLTVFRPSGALVTDVSLPFLFSPMSSAFGETIRGTYVVYTGAPSGALVVQVEVPSGQIRSERRLLHPSELGFATESVKGFSRGALGPGGEMAFGTGVNELVFFGNGADEVSIINEPMYVPHHPNDRDVEDYGLMMRGVFGGGSLSEEQLRDFAETTKPSRVRGRSLVYDDWGRLWVATQRDRDERSYIDVYTDAGFTGSLEIRDRIVGFDILGSILVTLVERGIPESDSDGIADRGIDWYRIEPPI